MLTSLLTSQPGAFATEVGSAANFKRAAHHIDGYDTAHGWINMLSSTAGQEPGDTRKGVQRIIKLVQQDRLPMRFALGVSERHPGARHAFAQ